MEYVVVRYPNEREVYIDGQSAGKTNRTLMVEKGHHLFDLGQPNDYIPSSRFVMVGDTTELTPLIVEYLPEGAIA